MIQRYAMQHGHAASQPCECGPAECESGYFCAYEDHAALVEKLTRALEEIEAIASGSTTANSLPHIAKLAGAAIAAAKEGK